jgi:hypothetical protein
MYLEAVQPVVDGDPTSEHPFGALSWVDLVRRLRQEIRAHA